MSAQKSGSEVLGRRAGETIGRRVGATAGRAFGEWLATAFSTLDTDDESATESASETERDGAASDHPDSREELDELSYRDLQQLAKDVGVKANLGREEMTDRIADALSIEDGE